MDMSRKPKRTTRELAEAKEKQGQQEEARATAREPKATRQAYSDLYPHREPSEIKRGIRGFRRRQRMRERTGEIKEDIGTLKEGKLRKVGRGMKKAGKVFKWTLGKAHEGKLELEKPLREKKDDWRDGYQSKFENQHWSIGDFQVRESDRYKMNVENAKHGKMIERTKVMDEKGNREDRYQEATGFSQRNIHRHREETAKQSRELGEEIGRHKDDYNERTMDDKEEFLRGKKELRRGL